MLRHSLWPPVRNSGEWEEHTDNDLQNFPEAVKDLMGFALYLAQTGGKHPSVKPLKGLGGAGVSQYQEEHQERCLSCRYR